MLEMIKLGTIYLITNIINNKKYVGQTIKKPKERWKEHRVIGQSDKYHSRQPISRAIHKYGIENFTFQILEQCEEKLLDEREKYWILFYDTFRNGYNATIGGQYYTKRYVFDDEELIRKYYEFGTIRKVARYYNCDHDVISHRLKSLGITIKPKTPLKRGEIVLKDLVTQEEYVFPDKRKAATWLVENNFTKSKNVDSVRRMEEGRIYSNRILVSSIRYSLYQ